MALNGGAYLEPAHTPVPASVWLFLSGIAFALALPWNFFISGAVIAILAIWNLAQHETPGQVHATH